LLADRAKQAGEAFPGVEPVQRIVDFICTDSSRNICAPRSG